MNALAEEKKFFSILVAYATRHRKYLLLTIAGMFLTTIISIAAPYFFRQALAELEQGEKGENGLILTLIGALVAYFLLTVVAWFSRAAIGIFSTRMNAGVIADLRKDTFDGLITNDMSYFDNAETGNIVSVLTNDLNELYDTGNAIADVVTSFFRLIGILIFLFTYSTILTLSALLLLPVFFIVTMIIRKYRRNYEREWRKSFGQVNQSFSETLKSIAVSKTFNREDQNIMDFNKLNETTYLASIKRGAAIFISQPVGDFLRNVLLITLLAVGVYAVQNLGLSISDFYLFIFLIDFYYNPVRAIARNYTRFQSFFANLERVLSISRVDEYSGTDGMNADGFSGHVKFCNVNFSYDIDPVLHNINFEIKPGTRVALVGHTGSGKTTIAALLLQLYQIEHGDILLDELSIKKYDLHSLRKAISIVSQDVLLFKGTIKQNLLLGNPQATEEEIWDAIEAVQAKEFIDILPKGLDTKITEGGKNLSAGQRQVLSFARTILSKPKLILLDEATSAVDLYTEAKIQQATDLLLENTTSLVIAHRLTTIIRSDLIVVLEKGEIMEMGSHDELIEQNGSYRQMFDLYFKSQSAEYLETVLRK